MFRQAVIILLFEACYGVWDGGVFASRTEDFFRLEKNTSRVDRYDRSINTAR